MLSFILFLSLLKTSLAASESKLSRALFTDQLLDLDQIECFKGQGFTAAFYQIYSGDKVEPQIGGVVEAGLPVELVVTPLPGSTHFGQTQAENAIRTANQSAISVSRIWLRVTEHVAWLETVAQNLAFIHGFIQGAAWSNASVGVYTSWYDYEQILGDVGLDGARDLWYWHTLGKSWRAATEPNFQDFRGFAQFDPRPLIKEFVWDQRVCGVAANLNVFEVGSGVGERVHKVE